MVFSSLFLGRPSGPCSVEVILLLTEQQVTSHATSRATPSATDLAIGAGSMLEVLLLPVTDCQDYVERSVTVGGQAQDPSLFHESSRGMGL